MILHSAWEDQSTAAHCILHTVPISYISTVMCKLDKHSTPSWASYAEQLCKECNENNTTQTAWLIV